MKYKNKDGIELNFTGDDGLTLLVKEAVSEACKILNEYNRFDDKSAEWAIGRGINFLKENFNIEDWDSKKEIGGKVVKVNYDIRLGVKMYSNLIKVDVD